MTRLNQVLVAHKFGSQLGALFRMEDTSLLSFVSKNVPLKVHVLKAELSYNEDSNFTNVIEKNFTYLKIELKTCK